MVTLEKILSENPNSSNYAVAYFSYLQQLLSQMDPVPISQFIDLLKSCRENNRCIYFIGNGGSAATCSHFSNDLAIGTRAASKPFKVVSLTDNNAVMTALANDDGYENVFKRQLETFMNDEDVVVAISASGNSANLITAVEYAKTRKSTIVGLTGFNGGKLKELSDINIHVQTPHGEYGPVEDLHMIVDHLIGSYLYKAIR